MKTISLKGSKQKNVLGLDVTLTTHQRQCSRAHKYDGYNAFAPPKFVIELASPNGKCFLQHIP